jgi:predicted nucleic acid-binding protein
VRVYVDSSVLLRVVLGERDALPEWGRITEPISSELIRIECLRTLDRARLQGSLEEPVLARIRADVLEITESFALVELDAGIKARAADPFPTLVRTLDALHLASALAVRGTTGDLSMATHDQELAIAAQALGFQVLRGADHA